MVAIFGIGLAPHWTRRDSVAPAAIRSSHLSRSYRMADTEFWADAARFVQGSRHRDTVTSPDVVGTLLAPTPAAFLSKFPLSHVLEHVAGLLISGNDGWAAGDDTDEPDTDDEGGDALMHLNPQSVARLKLGCELLERLITTAVTLPSPPHDWTSVQRAVRDAASTPAVCVRRVAGSVYRTLASLELPAVASPSPVAVRREQLFAADDLTALCGLFADKDTVACDRATSALSALCGAAGSGSAGRAPEAGASDTIAAPAASAEQLDALACAVAAAVFRAEDDDSAHASCSAPPSTRLVRAAHLLGDLSRRLAAAPDRREAALAAFARAGLVEAVLHAAQDDSDVLTQLNLLEAVPPLAASVVGCRAIAAAHLLDGSLLRWAGIGEGATADAFVGSTALSVLADTYAALRTLATAGGAAMAARPDADAADAPAALLSGLRAACVPGLFAAVAAACRSGSDVDASVHAIAACCTLLAADPAVLDAFLDPAHAKLAREWLENGVSTTPELRVAALAGAAMVLEGAHDAAPGGEAASGAAPASPARAPAAAGAGGRGSAGGEGPSGHRRYSDFFERLGAACGSATMEVVMAAIRKVGVRCSQQQRV